jgi:Pyruvate/2-oxoacid:ferredoxin oxidoreductase delta subunit
MDTDLFTTLSDKAYIPETELNNIVTQNAKPVSVYWELRSLLYLGIILFTTSAAILIYKNIHTIGHQVIIAGIAVVCILCFTYCIKNSMGYQNNKVESPNTWFDYVLLLGCLLLLTFIGYIQSQYNVFGTPVF